MEQKTADCLRTAERNRSLATELLSTQMQTPPFDWAVVIAFYAAVHYVNAYLWERDNRYDPGNHKNRGAKVRTLPDLRPIRRQYRLLNGLAYDVRYVETYRLNLTTARSALNDLRAIEAQIRPLL
jgi:hypothetical protein